MRIPETEANRAILVWSCYLALIFLGAVELVGAVGALWDMATGQPDPMARMPRFALYWIFLGMLLVSRPFKADPFSQAHFGYQWRLFLLFAIGLVGIAVAALLLVGGAMALGISIKGALSFMKPAGMAALAVLAVWVLALTVAGARDQLLGRAPDRTVFWRPRTPSSPAGIVGQGTGS